MTEATERKKIKSWKEKVWYEVYAPSMFGGAMVGEIPASDPSHLIGRVFETTLGDIFNDPSKSYVKLYFKITKVEDTKAHTEFDGHEMVKDYIRSLVRRRSEKVDEITPVQTTDGYQMRITSMAITAGKTKSSKISTMRKMIREIIQKRAAERTFDQFVQEMVLGKLAMDILKAIKVIHPIRRIEVYKSKILKKPQQT
ncbi:MAG: 30S ribosomal protein S3ae [Candidatus Hadarchaeales archaeon]